MAKLRKLNPAIGRGYGSLSQIIYRQLRDQILWGAITPGDPLTVRGLAERLAVSPMPVRDALRQLAAEELVEITPRSSTRVAHISLRTIQELFLLRRCLEPLAARLAVPNLTVFDIRRLRGFQEKLENAASADNPEAWHRWNQEFHLFVFRKSENTQLERIAQNLWDRNFLHFSGRAVTQAGFRERRAEEHREILHAFEARDAEVADSAWRLHMERSEVETVEFLRQLLPPAARRESRPPTKRAPRRVDTGA